MRWKAVYTDTDDLDPSVGIEKLEAANFLVVRLETHDAKEIARAAHDAHALLVGYAPIRESLLAQMPSLEIMSMLSTGFDNVDLKVANSRGVCVATVGATPAEEVATHALALLLSLIRGLNPYQKASAQRQWFKTPYPHIPPRLSEKSLGILGFGRIGQSLARMAAPLFKTVQFYDPLVPPGEKVEKFNSTSFETLIESSDVLSIHVPLTDSTFHQIDEGVLAQMRKGSYLINVSRGAVIDSIALRRAIDSGHIAAAAVDVLESEPPEMGDPLMGSDKIIVTPHVGYLSDYTLRAYIDVQAQNVIDWFSGNEVVNSINGLGLRR